MKFLTGICATLLLLTATAWAAAPPRVSIRPGETVTLKVENGAATVVSRTPAEPMSDYEIVLLRRMQMTYIPPGVTAVPGQPVYRNDIPVDPPKSPPGVIQLTFRHVPGLNRGAAEHSMLTISNGYDAGLRYRAVMTVRNRNSPTDVCAVMSNRPGVEHWPYPIDSIELSDFRFEAFDETHPPCE